LPRWWLIPVFIGFALPLPAQPNPLPYDKLVYWYSYFTDLAVNRRFALHFDTSYRLVDDSTWRQWVVRPGVSIGLSENWSLSLTYGYFKTSPNGLRVGAYAVPEHRVHQQFTYRHGIGRLVARHRIRNEQRWIGAERLGAAPPSFRFQERLRYLFRTDIPLRREPCERPSVYLSLYDEVGVRFGYRGASRFDQNRLYAGLGFSPRPSTTIEFGAFGQRFKPLSGERVERNVVVVVSVTTNMPLKRLGSLFR
jgi:hypothetical protein